MSCEDNKNLNIALWGAGTLDNWGDRLISKITESELAANLPLATFHHFCPWSTGTYASPLYINRNGRWPGSGMYDAIIVVGGGVLGGPPFKHPIMQIFCFGKEPRNFEPGTFLAWNAVGLQDGSLEPIRPAWRSYLNSVYERLDYCSVRSKDTADRITSNGKIGRPAVVPDPVFALAPLDIKHKRRQGKYRLGVALGSPFLSTGFLSMLAGPHLTHRSPFDIKTCLTPEEVFLYDISRNDHIRKQSFLPSILKVLNSISDDVTIEFFGFGKMYGDHELATHLHSICTGSHVVSVIGKDFDAVQALISSYDGLLVSRYHAAILTLRAGIPFVVADPYWSELTSTSKLHQLMIDINLEDSYWTYRSDEKFGAGNLKAKISGMLKGEFVNEHIYFDLHKRCKRNFENLCSALRNHM